MHDWLVAAICLACWLKIIKQCFWLSQKKNGTWQLVGKGEFELRIWNFWQVYRRKSMHNFQGLKVKWKFQRWSRKNCGISKGVYIYIWHNFTEFQGELLSGIYRGKVRNLKVHFSISIYWVIHATARLNFVTMIWYKMPRHKNGSIQ